MWRTSVALVGFACLTCTMSAQEQPKTKNPQQAAPAEYKIPEGDAKKPNPVKSTSASIADGKHLYDSQCAMCHGADGDGKGDLAADMKLKLRDLRDPEALKDSTDGELFYILTKGKGDMPGEEDRLSETQRWNLVNYMRSLASKAPPAKTPETKAAPADSKPKDDKPKDSKPPR